MSEQPDRSSWLRSPKGLGLLVLAVGLVYLATTHPATHLVSLLPYAFFLLCPLLHFLMHGGHQHTTETHQEGHSQHEGAGPS